MPEQPERIVECRDLDVLRECGIELLALGIVQLRMCGAIFLRPCARFGDAAFLLHERAEQFDPREALRLAFGDDQSIGAGERVRVRLPREQREHSAAQVAGFSVEEFLHRDRFSLRDLALRQSFQCGFAHLFARVAQEHEERVARRRVPFFLPGESSHHACAAKCAHPRQVRDESCGRAPAVVAVECVGDEFLRRCDRRPWPDDRLEFHRLVRKTREQAFQSLEKIAIRDALGISTAQRRQRPHRDPKIRIVERLLDFFLGFDEMQLGKQMHGGVAVLRLRVFQQSRCRSDGSRRVVERRRPQSEERLFRIVSFHSRSACRRVFEIQEQLPDRRIHRARAHRVPLVAEPHVECAHRGTESREIIFDDEPQHPPERLGVRLVHRLENVLAKPLLTLRREQQLPDEFPTIRS